MRVISFLTVRDSYHCEIRIRAQNLLTLNWDHYSLINEGYLILYHWDIMCFGGSSNFIMSIGNVDQLKLHKNTIKTKISFLV